LLVASVPAFSFIYGVPRREILEECRTKGIVTIGTATTPDEAAVLQDAGANAIVASGFEGGGRRGSFLRSAGDSLTGAFSLFPQIVDIVHREALLGKSGIRHPGVDRRHRRDSKALTIREQNQQARYDHNRQPHPSARRRLRVACAAAITHQETSHKRGAQDSGCECDDLGRIIRQNPCCRDHIRNDNYRSTAAV